MEGQQEQPNKAKVVKVDSVESWDMYYTQANNQSCPVSFLKLVKFSQTSIWYNLHASLSQLGSFFFFTFM